MIRRITTCVHIHVRVLTEFLLEAQWLSVDPYMR